jgi:lysophospholipase L1-like esterase
VGLAVACAHELAQSEPVAPAPAGAATAQAEATSPAPSTGAPSAVATQPPETPHDPLLTPQLLELRADAQRHLLGPGNEIEDRDGNLATAKIPEAADPEFAVDGNRLGNFIELENEEALAAFYQALADLADGKLDGGKLRVLAYGASHTQGDFFTGYLRRYLQARFGNGGLGFMQFAEVNAYYRNSDASVKSNAFHIEYAQSKDAPEHGRFGLLGAAAVAKSAYAKATITRSTRASDTELGDHLDVYYMNEPKGGGFRLSVDGAVVLTAKTRADGYSPGYASVDLPDNWSELSIRPRGNGSIRLFGGVIETNRPGIVIDTLGINGTRAANMLTWDEKLWREHVARRDPRLVILAYGTNETVDTRQPIADYEANLEKVIDRIKNAAPQASCLLVGPGDFPKEVEGGYIPRPRLLQIIDVQRKISFERGCGFWDTLEFMGGEGAMARWSRALPPMGARDRIHLTARGYVRWGMTLGDALMLPFDSQHAPDMGATASMHAR